MTSTRTASALLDPVYLRQEARQETLIMLLAASYEQPAKHPMLRKIAQPRCAPRHSDSVTCSALLPNTLSQRHIAMGQALLCAA
jgi:hypothetical protein